MKILTIQNFSEKLAIARQHDRSRPIDELQSINSAMCRKLKFEVHGRKIPKVIVALSTVSATVAGAFCLAPSESQLLFQLIIGACSGAVAGSLSGTISEFGEFLHDQRTSRRITDASAQTLTDIFPIHVSICDTTIQHEAEVYCINFSPEAQRRLSCDGPQRELARRIERTVFWAIGDAFPNFPGASPIDFSQAQLLKIRQRLIALTTPKASKTR